MFKRRIIIELSDHEEAGFDKYEQDLFRKAVERHFGSYEVKIEKVTFEDVVPEKPVDEFVHK